MPQQLELLHKDPENTNIDGLSRQKLNELAYAWLAEGFPK
jgi:hypothetical protein